MSTKIGKELVSTPADEILNNMLEFVRHLYDLDDFDDSDEAKILRELILTAPKNRLITSLISVMNSESGDFPAEHALTLPTIWFNLASSQESKKELVAQLSRISFDCYIFSYLNGIDETGKEPGEIAIRSVLNELHYPKLRDTSKDWSPDGKYKKVTRRKIVECLVDPVANFPELMGAVLYYDATFYEYFMQSVMNTIETIPNDRLIALMINDLVHRGGASSDLFEYTACWFRRMTLPVEDSELEKQLLGLSVDSPVFTYLNDVYWSQVDDPVDEVYLEALKTMLEHVGVFRCHQYSSEGAPSS